MGHLLAEGHDDDRVAFRRGGEVLALVGTIPFRPAGADLPGSPGAEGRVSPTASAPS
jgi:hypothetical protein